LPSKILDVFQDTQEIFFIHLTFQEFLSALHLASLEYYQNTQAVALVLEKASWREVLRFYAGILYSPFKPHDAIQKFEFLLHHAWGHRDELGIIESEIGYWFVEAGIKNPPPPFDQLKNDLWRRFDRGMQCAQLIFEPLLKEWSDTHEIEQIIDKVQSSSKDTKLLKYIPFIASSANLLHQQRLLELLFKGSIAPLYQKSITSAIGTANRVELIEHYAQMLPQMSDEEILNLLDIIASSQDSEYYPYIEPLLDSDNQELQDRAYESAIKIQAEPFLEHIESFFERYIQNEEEEKFSILYYWEDEPIVQILNRYALDSTIAPSMRYKIMQVMYENMHRESIAMLDKNDYLTLFEQNLNPKLKEATLMMYSLLLSVTPSEKLRDDFMQIQKLEQSIITIATNKHQPFELRATALHTLKANPLRATMLFDIYMPLSGIIFDESQESELRNGALEVICQQSYYLKEFSIVHDIFERGLEEFEGDMLINILYFIGQYGYHQYLLQVREYALNNPSHYIQGIAIQALGDLQDSESLEWIFDIFMQSEGYLREVAIETIIKLKPQLLLKYQEDSYVYRILCEYIVESGEVLKLLKSSEIKTEQPTPMLFISHASVDKTTIVEPLVEALQSSGIECWYD